MSQLTFWHHRSSILLLASLGAIGAGCNSSSNSGSATSNARDMADFAIMLEEPKPPVAPPADDPALADQRAIESAPSDESSADPSATSESVSGEPPADQGRAVAGRAPIGEGGYFVAIGGARRQILNRLEDLAWTQAVQHFQATEGRLPRDHQEFMTKIIEPLGIDLGYKEEDQEFLYDPNEGQWGTVYVVAKEPAPAE